MAKKKVIYQRRPLWWKNVDKILFLIALGIFVLLIPGQNIYTLSTYKQSAKINKLPFVPPTPAPYPVNSSGNYPGSDISATGVVILDVDSGVVLYRRNDDMELSPASTTKIMTALVALDTYKLDDIVTVRNLINNGQTMKLVSGERINVENLLYGTLIQSGNDAAYVLAENYPGGMEKFIEAMNQKAQRLHLTKTHFTNPVGYDDPNHKTSPMDLARLSQAALSNSVIAKMVAIPQITISDVTHTYFHALTNVNQLLGKVPGVGGIKTGWTEEAGENLVTLIERNYHKVIVVVLHSKDRFGETSKLIDWVFSTITWQEIKPTSN
ncbi:D-alanyl-D-alanine carboxypeptidase [Candidatus Gottesmanbacteria bacterium]|nr:D-alanyl-D-alanine carboxypeptidase [Candidatus Gottesmanbacteria bacterium]